jgi:hypothetical protein
MLSEANVRLLYQIVPSCVLMSWNIVRINLFPAKVDQSYFKGGCGALMLNIEFSSVYNLITLASLDVTFMRLWTL